MTIKTGFIFIVFLSFLLPTYPARNYFSPRLIFYFLFSISHPVVNTFATDEKTRFISRVYSYSYIPCTKMWICDPNFHLFENDEIIGIHFASFKILPIHPAIPRRIQTPRRVLKLIAIFCSFQNRTNTFLLFLLFLSCTVI